MAREPQKVMLHRQLNYLRMLHAEIERRKTLALARSGKDCSVFTSSEIRNSHSLGGTDPVSSVSERAGASETPKGCPKWESIPNVLLRALKSVFPTVRKSAASAIGKYVEVVSGSGALDRSTAQLLALSLSRRVAEEPNPQARQYAIKALAKFGAQAVLALPELKDAARDETAPHYVRSAAAESIAIIQEANRTVLHSAHHFCSRCRRLITEDDYRLSMDRFAKPYCRHCFDEVGLESRNFELKVEERSATASLGFAILGRIP